MLTPHRRHLATCPHASKGWNYTLCECPIWCDGKLADKRYKKSLGTNDWQRALRRIEILEAGGNLAPEPPSSAPNLAKAIKAFLQDATDRNLKPTTAASYKKTLEHLTKALGATKDLPAIDPATISSYRAGRTMAPRTWRKELEHLRAFFAFCQARRWIPAMITDNPAKRVRMPQVDDIATLPFTPAEVGRLIDACDQIASTDPAATPYVRHRARALVYILLYSGLRVSDIVTLRRSSLDESTGHLTLRVMKTGVPLKVLLHPDAVKSLASLPAQNPKYFFWTGQGHILHCANAMRVTIHRLAKIAKVDHAHPHRFRDTFAVELLTNGADIRTVQQLLGHTSIRTTEKHYAHFIASHQALLDRATAALDFGPKVARPVLMHPRKNARRNR